MIDPWPAETGAQLAPGKAAPTLKSVAWFATISQTILTGFCLFVVLMAWVAIGGVLSEPLEMVSIALFSAVVTVVAFAIGLPLRVVARLRVWWFRRASWTILLFLLAIGGVVASYFVGRAGPVHNVATADWPSSDGYNPDPALFLPSLGLLALASMHVLLPLRRWRGLD